MKLKIVATGDMFPGNMGYHSKIGIAWDFYKHKGKMWEDLFEEILMPSDICIVNLEAPLVHDDDFPNNDYFAGAVDFAAFMKRVGVTHANIANNHTLEQGKDGFLNTIKVLKKAGIEPIGCMDGSLPQVNYTEINGIMVGIVGFNQIHDIDPQGLYACYSEELVVQTLNRMEGVDLKIVVLHWGSEYVNIPSYEQTVSAKKFIDAGASIIIGHHPHVLQPVVMWNETVVAFSLGNILFDMWHSKNVRTGGILSIDYSKGQPLTYSVQGVFNYRQNQIKHILRDILKVFYEKLK